VDRESAYEILRQRAVEKTAATTPKPAAERPAGRQRETAAEALAKRAARAIGPEVGRRLIRGILGSLLGGRR